MTQALYDNIFKNNRNGLIQWGPRDSGGRAGGALGPFQNVEGGWEVGKNEKRKKESEAEMWHPSFLGFFFFFTSPSQVPTKQT